MVMQSKPIIRRKLSDECLRGLKALIETGEAATGRRNAPQRMLMERFQVEPAIRERCRHCQYGADRDFAWRAGQGAAADRRGRCFRQVDAAAKIMLALLGFAGTPEERAHLLRTRHARGGGKQAEAAISRRWRTLKRQQAALQGSRCLHLPRTWRSTPALPRFPAIRYMNRRQRGDARLVKEYHTEMLIWTGRENVTLTEHEEIIDCIRRGNPDEAEQAMIRHLERSRTLYAPKGR